MGHGRHRTTQLPLTECCHFRFCANFRPPNYALGHGDKIIHSTFRNFGKGCLAIRKNKAYKNNFNLKLKNLHTSWVKLFPYDKCQLWPRICVMSKICTWTILFYACLISIILFLPIYYTGHSIIYHQYNYMYMMKVTIGTWNNGYFCRLTLDRETLQWMNEWILFITAQNITHIWCTA